MKVERRERVIVRFAGDSGDGMQLAGGRFTDATAVFGNDLATLPSFPAEIRAPAGSLAGVSSFQIHFAERDIATPGDTPNVLVAMNPAALRANLGQLERGATIIVNEDAFTTRNLQKAGLRAQPARGRLAGRLPGQARADDDASSAARSEGSRAPPRATPSGRATSSRWASSPGSTTARPRSPSAGSRSKFADTADASATSTSPPSAPGWNFGETSELIDVRYEVRPATDVPPGVYRNVNGTTTTALGLLAASVRSGLPLVLSAYPITPASDLLHDLSTRQSAGVRTIQAEDEIAAAGMALGAAFGGALGVTATSGPGLDLKTETIGLAVALELPMVIVDVQRAGPSTGMPTKTEQSDLLAALYGRHGESPVPIVAASTPGQCFDAAYEAVRIAVRYRTPVILLTDLFLANGSEPWRIPQAASLPAIDPAFAQEPSNGAAFMPYARNDDGARPWAIPGTPGLTHRIGGLEKQDVTGEISYDPANHARMTALRAAKVAGIDVPDVEVDHEDGAELLVIGWGSSEGAVRAGVRRVRQGGRKVARAHLHHLNPLPANLGEVLRAYPRVLLPEMNSGQLVARAARRVPRRRAGLLARRGPPAVRGRDRAGDPGDAALSTAPPLPLTKADFQSDQETRWCPGCGDYSVLAAIQGFMPELGIPPEKIVFVTGIGCAGRFAYYMDTYGMHAIHGRAPTIATGLAAARDDLSVWIVSGDGDALSIGANHLVHALRRNVPVKILLFNNRIYGLTKGQASPTSEFGKVTKSTPRGSIDPPLDALSLALGRRRHLRRAHRRPRQAGPRRGPARGGRAPRHRLRRGPPGLPGLQRRRLRPPHPEGRRGRQPHQPGRRPADPLRPRPRARRRPRRRRHAGRRAASTRSAPTA